jgi:sporulation protein YlmC with PRC-barrel domain
LSLVHLEVAAGKKVRDADGRIAGRLEEVHADWEGGECVVRYYVIATKGTFVLRALNIKGPTKAYLVPWDRMDWSDPDHPRLTCRVSDLTSG